MNKIMMGIVLIFCALMLLGCTVPVEKEKATEKIMPPSFPEESEIVSGKEVFQVVIADDQFKPVDLEVKIGDSVEWTNQDDTDYIVTFDNGQLDEKLPVGGQTSYKFDKAGEYTYRCSIHPGMQGKIIVK